MSDKITEYLTNGMNKDDLLKNEDKSEFIRLAMKLLELKNITDTNEIKIHLQSLLKQPYDEKSKDSSNLMFFCK